MLTDEAMCMLVTVFDYRFLLGASPPDSSTVIRFLLLCSSWVVPFQHFKISSRVGPLCVLNEFPSGPLHEVYVVSERETSIVLQAIVYKMCDYP